MSTHKLWVVFSPTFKQEVEVPGMIGFYPIFDNEDYANLWAKVEGENIGEEIAVESVEFEVDEEEDDDGIGEMKLSCQHFFSTN